jgi:hypothetical protein
VSVLKIFRKRRPSQEQLREEARLSLARVLSPCGHCGSPLSGHEYALVAAEVINDNAESVTRLFGAVKKHDWLTLRSFQRWEGRFDNLEVYAIRCLRNRLSVAVLKAPFEFFEPDTLFCREVLDADQAVALRGAFPTIEWFQFPNETPS